MRNLLRVALLYGGRSGEHEVSLRSAASVFKNLDRKRFEVLPVSIDREGIWRLHENLEEFNGDVLSLSLDSPQVMLVPHRHPSGGKLHFMSGDRVAIDVDVFFPVLHGPLYEDGVLQGLFELAEVAYVGCGVLSSAMGMDKEIAKIQAQAQGIRIVPYISVHQSQWAHQQGLISARVIEELSYPVFVKPCNMGSSVGVHKVKDPDSLIQAMDNAFRYDSKILIEKAISAREIEVSALEGNSSDQPVLTSVAGEVVPRHEFYSYEAKYLDENGAQLVIPAKLSPQKIEEIRVIAGLVFMALQCQGLARVDFFVDRHDETVYFNEVNTLPGFTNISMYPKMWEATGLQYGELLSRLVDLALHRLQVRQSLTREWEAAE